MDPKKTKILMGGALVLTGLFLFNVSWFGAFVTAAGFYIIYKNAHKK